MNLIELRNLYRENLNNFSFKESDYLLNILLKENFNLESTFINLNPDYKLKESQINKILDSLDKLKNHYPIDYIINKKFFLDNEFVFRIFHLDKLFGDQLLKYHNLFLLNHLNQLMI